MKDFYIQAVENIQAELSEPPDKQEDEALEKWVMEQQVSLEELRDTRHMFRLYELHLVSSTSPSLLPLLIGHLKNDEAIKAIEKRLKGNG